MSSVLDGAKRLVGAAQALTGRQEYFLDIQSDDPAATSFSVDSCDVRECMGQPIEIRLKVTHAQRIPRKRFLNRDAQFLMSPLGQRPRRFSGFIASYTTIKSTADLTKYEIVLVSHLGRLSAVKNFRIFQHKTTPEIIETILSDHGIPAHLISVRLRAQYRQHAFRFQYNQTDLDYVRMLCQKAGIYLYVIETEHGDQIVLGDDIDHYVYDPELALPFREPSGLNAADESVYELVTRAVTVPKSIVVAEYNPEKAYERFKDEANVADDDPTTYGSPYIYGTNHEDQKGARLQAQLRHEAEIAWQVVYTGASTSHDLHVGRVFGLDQEVDDAPDGLLIVEIVHRGGRAEAYTNSFTAIPANRRFRLKFEDQNWPKIAGTLSARIKSPGGYRYAYLTSAGYYVVRFDLDFANWTGGGESVPLRMAKPFAGAKQTGMHFPAVDNDEAVIEFRDADPDKPYIAGFHHHSQAVDLVTNDRRWLSRNTIRTQSNNKLRMEDWEGQEGIKLSTEHSGKSQLNLGYLVDSKLENRGSGYELRSDGFGALRAGSGLLISTDKQERASGKQLDMAAAMNQLQIVSAQAEGLAQAASVANAEIADLKAENQWLKDSVNELRDAVMLLSSPKGIALATPDRISVAAGKDVNVATSAGFNVSTMRNVVLAATNAISLFAEKMGLKLYAARGKVQIQAQSDAMELVAQQNMQLCSAAGTLTANAANGVVLSGGGSAYIKVQGDNVEIGGAGNLILKIIEIQKEGPGSLSLPLPKFSQISIANNEKFILTDDITGRPLANRAYKFQMADGQVVQGKTDKNGETLLSVKDVAQGIKLLLDKRIGA